MTRTALVTGANRGIGAEIAIGLAEQGLQVVLGVRRANSAASVADRIAQAGGKAIVQEIDAGDLTSIETGVAALNKQGIDIDALVNNAGVLDREDLLALDDVTVVRTIDVNALGPLRLIRLLAPGMAERGYGRIVNVSSNWGSLNSLGPGAYGVSKALLNAITVKLADELPSSILINAMCPGWVATEMGGSEAPRTPKQGADTAVWLATLDDDGPRGGMFRDRRPIDWND